MAGAVSPEMFNKVMRSRRVQQGLRARAQSVADRAQSLNDSEDGTATITLKVGIRPQGRAYVNVQSDKPDEEHGTEITKRRAVLKRAAREGG